MGITDDNGAPPQAQGPSEIIYRAIVAEVRRMTFAEQMAFAGDLRKGRAFVALPYSRRATWDRVAAQVAAQGGGVAA